MIENLSTAVCMKDIHYYGYFDTMPFHLVMITFSHICLSRFLFNFFLFLGTLIEIVWLTS